MDHLNGNHLNSTLIEGCLVRDAESTEISKGNWFSTFKIATNYYYKVGSNIEKEVSFFTIETQGKTAETVKDLGRKGRDVRVVGRLKERREGTDGNVISTVYIAADHVEFRPGVKKEKTKPINKKNVNDEVVA